MIVSQFIGFTHIISTEAFRARDRTQHHYETGRYEFGYDDVSRVFISAPSFACCCFLSNHFLLISIAKTLERLDSRNEPESGVLSLDAFIPEYTSGK